MEAALPFIPRSPATRRAVRDGLVIAGLLILTLAAVATRWHWFSRQQPQPVEPSSSTRDTTSMAVQHHHHVA